MDTIKGASVTDVEILCTLKNEYLISEARYQGAKEAYAWKATRCAWVFLMDEMKVYRNSKIEVHFTDGNLKYMLYDLMFDIYKNEVFLMGKRILKSGQVSKNRFNDQICSLNYINNVKLIS